MISYLRKQNFDTDILCTILLSNINKRVTDHTSYPSVTRDLGREEVHGLGPKVVEVALIHGWVLEVPVGGIRLVIRRNEGRGEPRVDVEDHGTTHLLQGDNHNVFVGHQAVSDA